jgi:hypothetical protein
MKVSKHPLYHTWNGMVRRCNDPKNINYPHYGGRGILVFEEWAEKGSHGTSKTPQGFLRFLDYVNKNLGDKPKGYSLDRICNEYGYFPGNIRWADNYTQNNNRRCPNGKFRNIKKLPSGKYQVNMWYKKVNYCFGTYDTIEEAIFHRDECRKILEKK